MKIYKFNYFGDMKMLIIKLTQLFYLTIQCRNLYLIYIQGVPDVSVNISKK